MLAAMAAELDEQIIHLQRQEQEAAQHHAEACADEDRAWRMNEKAPRDPAAYSDATTRRAKWHSTHLRTVGELEDQKKIRNLITDPLERERWLADAADAIRGSDV